MTDGTNNRNFNPSSPAGGEGVFVPAQEMQAVFRSVLLQEGFFEAKAEQLAEIFTTNSVDGIYTHGVNRFPTFVQYVREGLVKRDAEPSLSSAFNGIEQWDGNLGPGPLNALTATNRAVELAQRFGIGCVALSNTNHWMRGGYYGWHAARKDCVLLAWTNTTALMPAWGAVEAKLGNNPLVLALPFEEEAIVLDMAMSQYSYGAMELAAAKGESLAVHGGYDADGIPTADPAAVLQSRRPMPVGYWKGAGLALLLDVLAAVLSGGLATHEITAQGKEYGLSQLFVCIDTKKLGNASLVTKTIQDILRDYHSSQKESGDKKIVYPGEGVRKRRKQNLEHGIPVLQSIWNNVLALQA